MYLLVRQLFFRLGRAPVLLCPVIVKVRVKVKVIVMFSRGTTPSPPIQSLGFGGFDSSRLLILRGGNSHVR